jgi:Matrixin
MHGLRRHARLTAAGLAVAAAVLACETATAPSRTLAFGFRLLNPDSTPGPAFHWPRNRLPVRYWVDPAAGDSLRAYVVDGLSAWERQFLYGDFRAVLVADSAGADVRVTIVNGVPPVAPRTDDPPLQNACAGTTSFDTAGAAIATPFTIALIWNTSYPPSDVANCLARVVTHEIGHSLGIFQHSPSSADLMYAHPAVTSPMSGDQQTVQLLYGTPSDLAPPPRTPGATDSLPPGQSIP